MSSSSTTSPSTEASGPRPSCARRPRVPDPAALLPEPRPDRDGRRQARGSPAPHRRPHPRRSLARHRRGLRALNPEERGTTSARQDACQTNARRCNTLTSAAFCELPTWGGRSERIRTSGPLLPKQVRYQAALHSDWGRLLMRLPGERNGIPASKGAGRPRSGRSGDAETYEVDFNRTCPARASRRSTRLRAIPTEFRRRGRLRGDRKHAPFAGLADPGQRSASTLCRDAAFAAIPCARCAHCFLC